jgi:diguanylate cyclase (GGDEF)-like protein
MPGAWSRNTRVLVAIGVLAVASLLIAGGAFAITDREQNAVSAASARLDELHDIAGDIADAVDGQEGALDDFILTGDELALARYEDDARQDAAAIERLGNADYGQPEIESALATLSAVNEDWQSLVAGPAIAARKSGNQAELDRFNSLAANDHQAVEAALKHADDLLDSASVAVTVRASSIGAMRLIGTGVAFGVFLVAFAFALFVVRRFGRILERDARQAVVLNRFTEVTSFAGDDGEIAIANLTALGRLVEPDASVTHILNRSLDRAVPEASTGGAVADVLPLHDLNRCAGMLRGSMYVSDDLADDLSVHCPAYPASSGTLACIPLSSGESVGAVHLYWRTPNGLPLERRAAVARITEHAALAIGNRRLLAALHGQANTDPRTGLANSRAFDDAIERTLASRAEHEVASVLMIDLDHFKLFNDRHGHPAGDEALRSFAGVLRSCMRDGDIAARYGGEEFAVLLPGVDREAAEMVAERIRARTESTIISLAPGITDRITVSVGIASAPEQGLERITLLRLADEALYRAKAGGRNRIVTAGDAAGDAAASALPVDHATRTRARRPA